MVRIRKITTYRFCLNGSHLQVEFPSQLLAILTNFRLAPLNEKANPESVKAMRAMQHFVDCVSSISRV